MATLLAYFRRRRALARAAFMVGATLKLAPYLTTPVQAQQAQRTNLAQIAGVDAVNMPYVCDNSTGIKSTVVYILSTQTQVVAGSTKSIYVCGFAVTTSSQAAQWKFVEGTSTDCITGQADKSGLFAASSMWGIAMPNSGAVQFKTSSGTSLCIDTTSSGIQGLLTYVEIS